MSLSISKICKSCDFSFTSFTTREGETNGICKRCFTHYIFTPKGGRPDIGTSCWMYISDDKDSEKRKTVRIIKHEFIPYVLNYDLQNIKCLHCSVKGDIVLNFGIYAICPKCKKSYMDIIM